MICVLISLCSIWVCASEPFAAVKIKVSVFLGINEGLFFLAAPKGKDCMDGVSHTAV